LLELDDMVFRLIIVLPISARSQNPLMNKMQQYGVRIG